MILHNLGGAHVGLIETSQPAHPPRKDTTCCPQSKIPSSPRSPLLRWPSPPLPLQTPLGENERNFVAGAATALIINGLIRQDRALRQQPRYVQPQPVYQPRPVYRTSIYNTAAALAFNSYSRSERVAIQRQLSRQGYYHSSIDGSFGPGTYNAVLAYARDNGASEPTAIPSGRLRRLRRFDLLSDFVTRAFVQLTSAGRGETLALFVGKGGGSRLQFMIAYTI